MEVLFPSQEEVCQLQPLSWETSLSLFMVNWKPSPHAYMDSLRSLRNFMLAYCEGLVSSLKNLPPNLIRIIILNRYNCNKPLSEWGLDRLTSLEDLWIEDVDENLVSFPPKEMLLPRSLIKLRIAIFPNLSCLSIKAIQSLTSLESLSIRSCPYQLSIRSCPKLALKRLLIVGNCQLLRERYQPGKGWHWPKISPHPLCFCWRRHWGCWSSSLCLPYLNKTWYVRQFSGKQNLNFTCFLRT